MTFIYKRVTILTLLLFLVALPSLTFAQSDLFTVSVVELDTTASSAAKAKKMALKEGEIIAFKKLVDRISPSVDIDNIEYDEAIVSSLVKSFEIDSEELSATRYIANVTFYFNPEETRNYIEKISNQAIISAEPGSVLILPVIRYNDIERGSDIWSPDNLWLSAWNGYKLDSSFIPIKLPKGDAIDMQLAPNSSIIKHDLASITKLMQRYKTPITIIAIFEMEDTDLKHALLHLYKYNNRYNEHIETVDISSNNSKNNVFKIAISKTIEALEEDWKQKQQSASSNLLVGYNSNIEDSMVANVVFNNIGEWIKIQRYLNDAYPIKSMEVISLNAKSAKLKLQYIGSIEQLRLALQSVGLEFSIPIGKTYDTDRAKNEIYEIQLKDE